MQYRYVLPDVAQARGAATTALQQAQELLNALYCSTGGSTYGTAPPRPARAAGCIAVMHVPSNVHRIPAAARVRSVMTGPGARGRGGHACMQHARARYPGTCTRDSAKSVASASVCPG